jgi:HK97 family phage major capsid protein
VSPDQALREVQQKIRDAQKPVVTPPGFVDLPAKDERQYSIVRAINAAIGARSGAVDPWKDAGLEKEVSHTIANRSNRQTSGFFLPLNIGVDVTAARRLAERAAVTGNVAATASIGGAGVQTSIVGFIDLLRARTQVVSMGAQMLTGLTDTIQFTRQLAANNFNWAGENPTSANALSAATLESFTMAPKVGMSSTAYSKRLLAQFSFDVNAFVMNDLTAVNAIGVDQAALFGTGANEQPKGVRSVTGVTLQTVASNGAAASWADLVLSETNVANANADIGTMGWLVSPKVRGKWKTTLKSTTAGSLYLWSENNTVNGYRAEVTTQIPDNTTMGTSTTICSTPIFGVWSELLIGEWGGALDVVVDPYTYAQQNMIQIVTSLMVDVGVRHPAAFNVALGVLTS